MRRSRLWLAAAVLCAGNYASDAFLFAGEPVQQRVLELHRTPEGRDYAAIGLRLPENHIQTPAQLAILVDTSASQQGAFREQSLNVLREMLSQIGEETAVAVWAVDVAQVALTDGFVTLTAEKTDEILAKLADRIPAGSTDLAGAIENSLDSIDTAQSARIVYLGDGYSAARLISSDEMTELVDTLADRQTPMISYALGAQKDLEVLGVLALRSGGIVVTDNGSQSAEEIAATIQGSVNSAVWYPSELSVTGDVSVLPNAPLPVRADRDTIYLGKVADEATSFTVSLSDGNNQLDAESAVANLEQGHAALRALWLRAEENNGLSIPTAGVAVLDEVKSQYEVQVARMLQAANTAANKGQFEESQKISRALLQLDPRNKAAARILNVQHVALLQQAVPSGDDQAPQGAVGVPTENTEEAPATVPDGTMTIDQALQNRPGATQTAPPQRTIEDDLIGDYRARQKAAGEKLALQVERAIEEARSIVQVDPEAAISIMKNIQGNIRIAQDIDPELLQNLDRRVVSVAQQLRAQREQIRNRRIRIEQDLAEQEARRRVIESMQLEEERLEQLIDQVRALLDDGFHGDPSAYPEAEAVAEAAVQLVPFSGAANSARFTAEAAGQLEDARYLRLLRADRFLETLTQVEFSHVPFPDEPPIRWPSAPVWKALTERRSIWKSVDLRDDSPAERRIRAALEEETELTFVDTPLADALNIIGELHNITILLDVVTLDDEGISSDEPVNIFISGIKLKSALKLMLEQTPTPVELTWIIEDEVMKITTLLKAEEVNEFRVYPVTDLVIPPQPLQGGGGGLGGGVGGGQMGGQGGGLGGGGLGGGGGGQFGGGGFFSIPPAALYDAKKNQ
ncbi:hypothetical protein [Rubinisphaera margarita]|uniref:hypothetical protein n=1 Tax=Rubinisphaera margarita TaxID=2909586 RepID=UPI001EE83F10|nr:hypothetical protein [Rubinisphaera margarita]MCG6156638.1 hypothetical protein [Rubinisphaera margarita]